MAQLSAAQSLLLEQIKKQSKPGDMSYEVKLHKHNAYLREMLDALVKADEIVCVYDESDRTVYRLQGTFDVLDLVETTRLLRFDPGLQIGSQGVIIELLTTDPYNAAAIVEFPRSEVDGWSGRTANISLGALRLVATTTVPPPLPEPTNLP